MKICLVTPDINGPILNGGIGTHCLRLAELLAGSGRHEVSVLFTSPFERGTLESHRTAFKAKAIAFHHCDEAPQEGLIPDKTEDWFLQRSHAVFRFLRTRDFDVVHLQDWNASLPVLNYY